MMPSKAVDVVRLRRRGMVFREIAAELNTTIGKVYQAYGRWAQATRGARAPNGICEWTESCGRKAFYEGTRNRRPIKTCGLHHYTNRGNPWFEARRPTGVNEIVRAMREIGAVRFRAGVDWKQEDWGRIKHWRRAVRKHRPNPEAHRQFAFLSDQVVVRRVCVALDRMQREREESLKRRRLNLCQKCNEPALLHRRCADHQPVSRPRVDLRARDLLIYRIRRRKGLTYTALSQRFGISRTRARQIVEKQLRKEARRHAGRSPAQLRETYWPSPSRVTTCDRCGTKISRGARHCRQHESLARRRVRRIRVRCAYCNRRLERPVYEARTRSGLHFCNHRHQGKWLAEHHGFGSPERRSG